MTTDDQVLADLSASAARFLRERWPLTVDQPTEGVRPEDAVALWRDVGELGWGSIVQGEQPEDALAAAPLLAGLFGVLGGHPAPLPMLDLAVAVPVLATVDHDDVLAPYVEGERLAVVAHAADPALPDEGPWAGAVLAGGQVTGARSLVAHATVADAVITAATVGGQPAYALVEHGAPGTVATPLRSYDRLDLPGHVSWDGAPVTLITQGDEARRVEAVISTLSRAAIVAELGGLGAAAIRLAVDYARERSQFGRPIGGFQAVKHLLADAWIDVYACESAAEAVARQVAEAETVAGAAAAADLALVFAAAASRRVLEAALQVHGGIGFTLDYQLNWYFNRALSRASVLGSREDLAAGLGRAIVAAARGERA